jgi:chromosome partitioning protein
MPIIALVNQKGGCAKSTTSVHLARWLESRGHDIALVDADAQRSSSIWIESMESAIAVHVLQGADELLDQLPDIAAEHAYTVVDGPAGLSESTRAILFRADLALVPCQPTGVDLRSAADAIKLVRQAQSVRNGPPDAAVFLARAVKGTRLKDEALGVLGKTNIPILKTVIHQKQVVADTFGQQATVWDIPGRAATESAGEFERLFKEVLEMLS